MDKRKTKLVCVGWGIWWLLPPVGISPTVGRKATRQMAIKIFNEHHTDPDYETLRKRGDVIAKKLWVEVKVKDA